MNKLLFLIGSFAFLLVSCNSEKPVQTEAVGEDNQNELFDGEYANQLGADDYGMKQYVMALLKAGPNRGLDRATAADLQEAHLNNIKKLAEEGKLMLAGPFLDEGDLRGIYIFNVTTVEEAKALTETDPAIIAGSLVMELHPWYGSAALAEINNIHKRIAKISF